MRAAVEDVKNARKDGKNPLQFYFRMTGHYKIMTGGTIKGYLRRNVQTKKPPLEFFNLSLPTETQGRHALGIAKED